MPQTFIGLLVLAFIALIFGLLLLFAGYRFFIFLLPIWGFFFGFGLGAQSIQAIFGDAFLSTITSWVVGFVVAIAFALLAYLFYFAAIAIIAGGFGYALGVGLMQAIGIDFGLLVWIVGMTVAIVVALLTLVLNIQMYVVVIATALLGAEIIVAGTLVLFGGLTSDQLMANPIKTVLNYSPFWAIVFVVLAVVGIVAQLAASRRQAEMTTYNRLSSTPTSTA